MDRSRIAQHVKPLIASRRVKALTLGGTEGTQAGTARGKTAKARAGSRGYGLGLAQPAGAWRRSLPMAPA